MGEHIIGFRPPNELVLSFQAPRVCAKFRQNRSKIASERARTDRQTHTQTEMTQVILLSVPCYAIAMGQITINNVFGPGKGPKALRRCCCCCWDCCYRFRKMPKAFLMRNGLQRNFALHIRGLIPDRSAISDV